MSRFNFSNHVVHVDRRGRRGETKKKGERAKSERQKEDRRTKDRQRQTERKRERERDRRGEHVVSVVRHERKLERGSLWWRPGNRKRPNAPSRGTGQPEEKQQRPERKSNAERERRGLHVRTLKGAFAERKSNLEQRSRHAKREKKRKGLLRRPASC